MIATIETFRATHSPTGRVDKVNRVIYGVAIVEKGPVRFDNRKQYADDETLRKVLALGRAAADGVKSHLSHGDAVTDGIFNHLGRFRNFRVAGDATVADLHVARSAKDGDYVLELAAEDPKAFGASMVSMLDRNAPQRADGFQAIRPLDLVAIDLVGVPALTSGLLAAEFSAKAAASPSRTPTHLDAVEDFMSDPASLMRDGRSLEDHVDDWFSNNRGAYEFTADMREGVRRQSDELRRQWENGELSDGT